MTSTAGWSELLIEGTADAVRALASGMRPQRVFRGEDLKLHAGSFPDRILDLLGAKTHHLLFAPAEEALELKRRIEADPELRLEHVREIQEASFAFAAESYSYAVAEKIEKLIRADHPAGVKLEDFAESKERDPDAKGLDIKGAVHELTYCASGRFSGPPPGIFVMYERMRDVDFVDEKELEIKGREAPSPGA
jgi:hypothetical protein